MTRCGGTIANSGRSTQGHRSRPYVMEVPAFDDCHKDTARSIAMLHHLNSWIYSNIQVRTISQLSRSASEYTSFNIASGLRHSVGILAFIKR